MSYLVRSIQLIAVYLGLAVGSPSIEAQTCGAPIYNVAVEQGVFLWEDCDTRIWHARFTGSGNSNAAVSYEGTITSDQPLINVAKFKLEATDVLDTSNPQKINYKIRSREGEDGIDFSFPPGANVCLSMAASPNIPIFLGSGRTPIGNNFALSGTCGGPIPPGDRYNFVVILTDDQRWDTLWAMPILQARLAARGVTFTNAFVTTPLCCPSRGNILSGGFYAHNTGVLENPGDNGGAGKLTDNDTLGTTLQQAGYRTLFVGKYLNGYGALKPYVPPGWTLWIGNNEEPGKGYTNFTVTIGSSTPTSPGLGEIVGPIQQYVTDYHRDQVLAFLDTVGSDPFMVFLAPFAPHTLATPASGDENLFSDYLYRARAYGEADLSDKPDWVKNPYRARVVKQLDDEFNRNQLRSLQAVDRAIGSIVDKIEAQGKLDRTVFIFTSDNGYLWGEHGLTQKGQPYEESIRVPLVMVMPGIPAGINNNLVAADLDLGATLFGLAGISKQTDGKSLLPLIKDPSIPWRTELLIETWGYHEGAYGTWAALRTNDWKYIVQSTGEKELYDLRVDPFEQESKHNDPAAAAILADLSVRLDQQKGLTMTKFKAPPGTVNKPYRFQPTAWGGQQPYSWTIYQGILPNGLQLNKATGEVKGIPKAVGTKKVKIKVADSSVATHSKVPQQFIVEFTFNVSPNRSN